MPRPGGPNGILTAKGTLPCDSPTAVGCDVVKSRTETTERQARVTTRLRAAGCVFAEDEAALLISSTDSRDELERRVAERESGVPLEHVLGWALFDGLHIPVDHGVFVPRPRTEHLVARAATWLTPRSLVLDLCCGTGAVGAALLERVPGARLIACDLDPAAVANARRTLEGRDARLSTGDLYDAVPPEERGHIDLVVIVAPYVPTGELEFLPHEARDFESFVALDGGGDGLAVLRRAIADAPHWLAPGGVFLTEVGETQAAEVAELMRQVGLVPCIHHDAELGVTIVEATR